MSRRPWDDAGQLNEATLLGEPTEFMGDGTRLPESDAWQAMWRPGADLQTGIRQIRALLARRKAGEHLPSADRYPDEHSLAATGEQASAWLGYKLALHTADWDRAELHLTGLERSFPPTGEPPDTDR